MIDKIYAWWSSLFGPPLGPPGEPQFVWDVATPEGTNWRICVRRATAHGPISRLNVDMHMRPVRFWAPPRPGERPWAVIAVHTEKVEPEVQPSQAAINELYVTWEEAARRAQDLRERAADGMPIY